MEIIYCTNCKKKIADQYAITISKKHYCRECAKREIERLENDLVKKLGG